jgi:ribonuclease R
VRLEDYLVEGLVKVRDLHDDFYKLDERAKALVGTRTGRTFQLGQGVRVTLSEIDMARRQADFRLYQEDDGR